MQEAKTPWGLFAWAVWASKPRFAMMSLAAVAVAACEMLIPWLIAQAIDAALTHHDTKSLDLAGIAILLVVTALYFFHVLYLGAEVDVLYAAIFRLRQLLYTRILDQPIGFFATAKSGELHHRVINDVEALKAHGVSVFSEIPFAALTIIGVLTIMFATDWHLASMTFVFLVVAAAISAWLGRPLPNIRNAIQSLGASLSQRLTETFAGIRTVKIFGLEDYEAQRLDLLSRAEADHEIQEGRIGARVEPVLELMEMLGVVLIVWYGAHLVVDGRITPGILVAFIAYLELLSDPLSRSGRYYRQYLACHGIMERLATFVASLPRGLPREQGLQPTVAIDVVYEDVAFSYPGAGRHAADGISLSARPRDIIAIVGRNGAGKSTSWTSCCGFGSRIRDVSSPAGSISRFGVKRLGARQRALCRRRCSCSTPAWQRTSLMDAPMQREPRSRMPPRRPASSRSCRDCRRASKRSWAIADRKAFGRRAPARQLCPYRPQGPRP